MEYTSEELISWARNNGYGMDLNLALYNNTKGFFYLNIEHCKVLEKGGNSIVRVPLIDSNEFMNVPINNEDAWAYKSKKINKYLVKYGDNYKLVALSKDVDHTDYFIEELVSFCNIRTRGKMVKLFKDAYALYKKDIGIVDDFETLKESMGFRHGT